MNEHFQACEPDATCRLTMMESFTQEQSINEIRFSMPSRQTLRD